MDELNVIIRELAEEFGLRVLEAADPEFQKGMCYDDESWIHFSAYGMELYAEKLAQALLK